MLATIAVLAFALSDDPTREYREANTATLAIASLEVAVLLKNVSERYAKERVFSSAWIESDLPKRTNSISYDACLSTGNVSISTTLAVVSVPDPTSASIRTLLDYLTEGEVFLVQVSRQAITGILGKAKFDCKRALSAGLVAIRVGSNDVAIRSTTTMQREVRSLSSLELVKYLAALKSTASAEERAFGLMNAIAQTATLELEYRVGDSIRLESLTGDATLASGARDVVKAPAAIYLPSQVTPQTTVVGPLRRNLGLIGDLSTSRAAELLASKIQEKAKYPTVYGTEIRSAHAIWGMPLILLSLACFLLLHVHSYRRAHAPVSEVSSWVPNVLLMSGVGPATARILTLMILPPISGLLLARRLTESRTPEAWVAYFVCALTIVVGAMVARELRQLRNEQQLPTVPTVAPPAAG